MKHQTGHFQGLGGLDLYYQGWLPEDAPSAVLLVVHGLAEHGGRYGNVVTHLVPRGYAVYAPDHRGHGRSPGQRAYVEHFSHYLDDLKRYFDQVRGRHPETQIFMLGHSMGGTISLAYALRHQDELAGLILSGAGIRLAESASPALIAVGRIIAALLPKMGMIILDASAISRDPKAVAAYKKDPLVYRGKISARLGAELIKTIQTLPQQISKFRMPVLILHGGADRLTDPEGSRWLYENVESADKTLKIYDGYYHEVFNDLGREQVLADVEAWLAARLV